MKKRDCRRTPEQEEQHRTAVEIRKKTDAKLCEYIADKANEIHTAAIMDFLTGLPDYKGIGQATRGKLWDYAREKGFLPESSGEKL